MMKELPYATLVGLDQILQELKQKEPSRLEASDLVRIAGDANTAIHYVQILESKGQVKAFWVESGRPPAMLMLEDLDRKKVISGGFTGQLK